MVIVLPVLILPGIRILPHRGTPFLLVATVMYHAAWPEYPVQKSTARRLARSSSKDYPKIDRGMRKPALYRREIRCLLDRSRGPTENSQARHEVKERH